MNRENLKRYFKKPYDSLYNWQDYVTKRAACLFSDILRDIVQVNHQIRFTEKDFDLREEIISDIEKLEEKITKFYQQTIGREKEKAIKEGRK